MMTKRASRKSKYAPTVPRDPCMVCGTVWGLAVRKSMPRSMRLLGMCMACHYNDQRRSLPFNPLDAYPHVDLGGMRVAVVDGDPVEHRYRRLLFYALRAERGVDLFPERFRDTFEASSNCN